MFYADGISACRATDISRIKSSQYRGNVFISLNFLTYTDNLADLEIDFIEKGATVTLLILDEIYASTKINLYYATDEYKVPFYFYKTPSDPRPIELVIHYCLQGVLSNYIDNRSKFQCEKSGINIS